ncbi:M48 family metallopeptidase [Paenibacillus eucommiae]|uniref:Zn-dependent protease with chaperone function n=1 Tax=Paenibacillus eucommiae TaxID=1355755 RepID=A0ABS4IXX9_9BACL|nr:M48 family metallopeptidase [Paenibacillus eucommiae]MBP1992453.1 Zn-dependent protease with chaperone function [Paenibacillus eucommiae]
MRKIHTMIITGFILYAAVISIYLMQGDLYAIPSGLQGTAADPATFMTGEQIIKAESLSRINSLGYFILTPMQIGLLLILLGVSVRLRDLAGRWFRHSFWQMAAFVGLFLLLFDLLFLPIDYLLLRVNQSYGISNETLALFFSDHIKNFLINGIGTLIIVAIFRLLLNKSPRRWWLWLWLISIPLLLFVSFVQPVLLDPLYNDFQPLQDQGLKKEILTLAEQADIPTDQVYQVNMSERTNAINAYVNGIGGNARIVLWDTILNKLQKEEILSVMAHEMGHFVEKHIYWGILYGMILSFIGFWLASYIYRYSIQRWGAVWGIHGERDLAALPVLLAIVAAMGFLSAPAQNTFSRVMEHRADTYAMKITHNGDAAIHAFQKIAKENLAPVTQPKLIKWFRGSHPTIAERIVYFEQYAKE